MRISLEVKYSDDKEVEVIASAPDIVKFEDKFNISIAVAAREMKVTHLLFLAHAALVRQKTITADFDTWIESVVEVGVGSKDPK